MGLEDILASAETRTLGEQEIIVAQIKVNFDNEYIDDVLDQVAKFIGIPFASLPLVVLVGTDNIVRMSLKNLRENSREQAIFEKGGAKKADEIVRRGGEYSLEECGGELRVVERA